MKVHVLEKKSQFSHSRLSLLLFFAGSTYLLYLQVVFPKLVPHHGGGERFTLSGDNNFTDQIPWSAFTRLHLTLQASETVELYVNGDYVCDCTRYDFVIEAGDEALIRLEANAPVLGMFTAWQETPLEEQMLALVLLLISLTGIAMSIRLRLKK